MAKAGDKFIVEIESVYGELNGNEFSEDEEYLRGNPRLYKIKGFRTLVFDDADLWKLEKYEENQHEPPPEEIIVGDEVATPDGRKFVATYVSKTDNYVAGLDPSGNIVGKPLGFCVRTGKVHNFLASAVKSLKE